jgi:hypothetical protein
VTHPEPAFTMPPDAIILLKCFNLFSLQKIFIEPPPEPPP